MLLNVDALNTSPLGVLADTFETGTLEAPLAFRVLPAHPAYLEVQPRTRDMVASDWGSGDRFGTALALDQAGTKMIVGAPQWEGATGNMGGVYTYTFDADSRRWSQVGVVLSAADYGNGDNFGSSVALSADGLVLAVGVIGWEGANVNQGGVYIYDWSAGTSAWVQRGAVLEAPDAVADDWFGSSVALNSNGSVLIVGAAQWEGTGVNQGGVYTFDYSGGSWVQRGSVLVASDAAASDLFGTGVALSADGNVLFVGSPQWEGASGTDRGGVYVYDVSGPTWTMRGAVHEAADAANTDHFGNAVATNFDGTVMVVGARYWEGEFDGQGAVYVYDWSGGVWTLRPSMPMYRKGNQGTGARYGEAVAMGAYGTSIAVGLYTWGFGTLTNYGNVMTYDVFGKRITGTVADLGVSVARKLRAYERDTGYFVGGCISESDGTFTMGVKTHKDCFVVALDDLTFDDHKNAVINDKITPY